MRPGRSRTSGTGTEPARAGSRSRATRLAPKSRLALAMLRVTALGSPRVTRSGSASRSTVSRGRQATKPSAPATATTAALPSAASSG